MSQFMTVVIKFILSAVCANNYLINISSNRVTWKFQINEKTLRVCLECFPKSSGTRRSFSTNDLNLRAINFELKWLHLFGTTHYPVFGLSFERPTHKLVLEFETILDDDFKQPQQKRRRRTKVGFCCKLRRENLCCHLEATNSRVMCDFKAITKALKSLQMSRCRFSFLAQSHGNQHVSQPKIIHEQLTRFLDIFYTCLTSIQRLDVWDTKRNLNCELSKFIASVAN